MVRIRCFSAVVVAALLALTVPSAVTAQPDDGAARCGSCGRDVASGYRFCPFDGSEVERTTTCARCNRPLEPGWRFCPWDGTAVAQGSPVTPTTPAVPPSHQPTTEETSPSAPGDERGHKNPFDTVDSLFNAIGQRDERRIRGLYDWTRFLPAEGEETAEAREERISGYVKRLLARVRPTIEGTNRRVTDVKLNRTEATLTVIVHKADTRAVVQEYRFTLADSPQGWRITAIAP